MYHGIFSPSAPTGPMSLGKGEPRWIKSANDTKDNRKFAQTRKKRCYTESDEARKAGLPYFGVPLERSSISVRNTAGEQPASFVLWGYLVAFSGVVK